ncbi:hypothetical protein BGZ73_007795 [Actinomortierella ambigua]|nr:hypothetical protein BGZ73_007795 [Actinomortierella ambigua]
MTDPQPCNSNDDKHSIYPKGQPGTLSLSVPLFAVLLFALIILATMGIAHCLYRRYARNLERAFGVHNDNNNNNSQVVGSYTWRFSNYNDVSDGGQEPTEHDRLLGGQPSQGRQRSTSYYDANRSWSAAPVAIQTDMKGRPITTWSTASSVAAQRGEELSRWSKRRDELIAQYGQGSMLPSRGGDSSSHQYSRQNQSGNYNSLAEDPDENAQERDGEEE